MAAYTGFKTGFFFVSQFSLNGSATVLDSDGYAYKDKIKVMIRMCSVDRQTGLPEIFYRRSEIVIFPVGKQSSYSIHFK